MMFCSIVSLLISKILLENEVKVSICSPEPWNILNTFGAAHAPLQFVVLSVIYLVDLI